MSNSFLKEYAEYESGTAPGLLGNAAEGVMACALAARLMNRKSEKIMPSDVLKVMRYFSRDKNVSKFKSLNSEGKTRDRILLEINLGQRAYELFLNPNTFRNRRSKHYNIVRSATNYVNERETVKECYDFLCENQENNTIQIKADGLSNGNKGLKADIYVTVEGTPMQLSLALKTGHGKLAGQGAGFGKKELQKDYGYETHRSFIRNVFNVDVGNSSGIYFETANNMGEPSCDTIFNATRNLYSETAKKLQGCIRGDYDTYEHRFLDNDLVNGIKNMTVKDTDSVEYVRLYGLGKYQALDFNNVLEVLKEINIDVNVPSDQTPMLKVVDRNSGEELFQIRTRKEKFESYPTGYRYKIYFEPKKLLRYLIVQSNDQ